MRLRLRQAESWMNYFRNNIIQKTIQILNSQLGMISHQCIEASGLVMLSYKTIIKLHSLMYNRIISELSRVWLAIVMKMAWVAFKVAWRMITITINWHIVGLVDMAVQLSHKEQTFMLIMESVAIILSAIKSSRQWGRVKFKFNNLRL